VTRDLIKRTLGAHGLDPYVAVDDDDADVRGIGSKTRCSNTSFSRLRYMFGLEESSEETSITLE
jgi:hypothetical protein